MKINYDRNVPGPGKYYCTLKTFGNDGAKYSIKGKYHDIFTPNICSPGPAAYDPATKINLNGVFGVSKFKNVQSVYFSKGGAERFPSTRDKTPGPADYKKSSLIGNIYDSRYKSTHGIHMSLKYKPYSFASNNNPGPGAYECYGDFTRYDNNYLNRSQKGDASRKSSMDSNKNTKVAK